MWLTQIYLLYRYNEKKFYIFSFQIYKNELQNNKFVDDLLVSHVEHAILFLNNTKKTLIPKHFPSFSK